MFHVYFRYVFMFSVFSVNRLKETYIVQVVEGVQHEASCYHRRNPRLLDILFWRLKRHIPLFSDDIQRTINMDRHIKPNIFQS